MNIGKVESNNIDLKSNHRLSFSTIRQVIESLHASDSCKMEIIISTSKGCYENEIRA